MKRRLRWSHAVIALAVIAALAIAAPAIGISSSLKKAIKKEVAKQIGKAEGPAGPAGANGVNGANGADGTARAYANVRSHAAAGCAPACTIDRSKGIAGVTSPSTGTYCIDAPGLSSASLPAAVTVESEFTGGPEGNATATTRASAGSCPPNQFQVITERQAVTTVRNAADTGPIDVSGLAFPADDVSFTIVIP